VWGCFNVERSQRQGLGRHEAGWEPWFTHFLLLIFSSASLARRQKECPRQESNLRPSHVAVQVHTSGCTAGGCTAQSVTKRVIQQGASASCASLRPLAPPALLQVQRLLTPASRFSLPPIAVAQALDLSNITVHGHEQGERALQAC
jgi:hypothetical protein